MPAARRRTRHDLVVQLAVARLHKALEEDPRRDEVLGTTHREGKVDCAVGEVVAAYSRRGLIRADAPKRECGVVGSQEDQVEKQGGYFGSWQTNLFTVPQEPT